MSLFNISCALFLLFLYFPELHLPFFTYFCISVAVQHLFSTIFSPEMSSVLMALFVASEEMQEAEEAEAAEAAEEAA